MWSANGTNSSANYGHGNRGRGQRRIQNKSSSYRGGRSTRGNPGNSSRGGSNYTLESNTPSLQRSATSTRSSKIDKPPGFDVIPPLELTESIKTWYSSLLSIWQIYKHNKIVTSMINDFFSMNTNPYLDLLKILYNYAADFKEKRTKNLILLMLEEFDQWIAKQPSDFPHRCLTVDIQHIAFNLTYCNKTNQFIFLVVKIYKLEDLKLNFIDWIKYLVQTGRFKEACQMAMALKLYEPFDAEDFVIPLILQGKLDLAEEYLVDSTPHQISTIKFFDSTLNKRNSVTNTLDSFITSRNITQIKYDKLRPKPMSKLISRLLKLFNLPDCITPNMNNKRIEGLINYLARKRFIERNLSDESWDEMVQEAVADDPQFQRELVFVVSTYDLNDALRWARKFSLERHLWPYGVRMLEKNPDDRLQQIKPSGNNYHNSTAHCSYEDDKFNYDELNQWNDSETNNTSIPYLTLSLPHSDIVLINNEKVFTNFLDHGLRDVKIVGMDAEWKPNFGTKLSDVALIQLATENYVYILDIIVLGKEVPYLWRRLSVELFDNTNILKLGFGMATDLQMLRQSLPNLNVGSMQGVGYLDLTNLWRELVKIRKFTFPFENKDVVGSSLSSLVELCLGVRLDKSEQFSNWENRPLRSKQLIYAALDAHCLLQIYDVLSTNATKQGIVFDDICYKIMHDTKGKRKPTRKQTPNRNSPNSKSSSSPQGSSIFRNAEPKSVRSVRFVCDTMLGGLGKSLRKCGIDTVIINSPINHHEECVHRANKEKRFILTRGSVFNKLRQYVPNEHCYQVVSDNVEEQTLEVLQYYNVVVKKEDVFSRCQICNSGSFLNLNQHQMQGVLNRFSFEKDVSHKKWISYNSDEESLEDEAFGFSNEEDNDTQFEGEACLPIDSVKLKQIHLEESINEHLETINKIPHLQIDNLPKNITKNVELFYICKECGKIYWDGSHWERVLSNSLHNIVC